MIEGNNKNRFLRTEVYVNGRKLTDKNGKRLINILEKGMKRYLKKTNRINLSKRIILTKGVIPLIMPLLRKVIGLKQDNSWINIKEKIINEEYKKYKKDVKSFLNRLGFKERENSIEFKDGSTLKNLREKVTLIGINGLNTKEGASEIIKSLIYSNKGIKFKNVKFLSPLDIKNKYRKNYSWEKISPLTYKEYNEFIVKNLHKYVNTEYVLLIQDDGFIINPLSWSDKFLKYDYIGGMIITWKGRNHVGNGGFSLRSKKLLKLCSKFKNYNAGKILEDVFICSKKYKFFTKKNCVFAPPKIASRFSLGEYNLAYPYFKIFGFHGKAYPNLVNLKKRIGIG